ncbi:MAG: radical SAM protein [Bacteroidetes bacterium]|nr:radical SAM protein [Bacteroidota bacterium]
MHITLHLTTGCNMSCGYCYSPPNQRNDMSQETAFRSIDFITENYPINTGIIFFGGEPLLKKKLIKETITYCKTKEKSHNAYFHYKITTNGILLDADFMEYANKVNLQVAMSIDGNEKAHNTFRKSKEGKSTFEIVNEKIDILLHYQPYAKALMTVSPETLIHFSDSVDYLLNRGFKYIIVSLNYAVNWADDHIKELKKQYEKIATLYEKWILNEKKFYFSPFEMKLASHIRSENFECNQCHLAIKQLAFAHDGSIYPCVQFVKDGISNKTYCIGSVETEIDVSKQTRLNIDSKKQTELCSTCDYNPRCNNKCSCLNWQLTGTLNQISPIVCETERVLIPVVDALGERLYKKGAAMFIQKHYNAVYPIISMIEDMN